MTKIGFRSYAVAHALSAGMAVFIVFVINYYFAFGACYWMILGAYLITQTTIGTPVRQGLHIFLVIICAIILASLLLSLKYPMIQDGVLALVFLLSGLRLLAAQINTQQSVVLLSLFVLMFMLASFAPCQSTLSLSQHFINVGIGALVGIVSVLGLLPTRIPLEFRQGILPVLTAYAAFADLVALHFLGEGSDQEIELAKRLAEEKLYADDSHYPEWVYEIGFNPVLRPGFRYFLITMDRILEVLYAMHYLGLHAIENKELLKKITESSQRCIHKNKELFAAIIANLSTGKMDNLSANYTQDIAELEQELRHMVPSRIEMLDIKPDYIYLTAFVRDLKDLRELLLQLAFSLPGS